MGNNMIPNIPSSGYPNIDNVNTWLTQTTFNYALWAANSKLTVTRVPWNEDYKDVVKFADDAARDAYFASIESISKKIDNAVRIPKDGTVVLPFNFDEMITYNYLIAEYPLPNGYVRKGDKVKTKFFYFIVDMTYKNANVTECTVVLDYWTTFINDVEIGNSCLHRGHAPMTLTSVENYLASPNDHTQGLLTPDVNFGVANNVQNEDYVPFHTGTQYVLIATTSNPQGDWTNNTTCISSYVVDGLPTNVYVFAINASNYVNFISKMNNLTPQMLQTILSVFILDESFITLGTSFNFLDTQCFAVQQKETSLKDINLEKSMFNYPTEYDWITKLYTSPYAVLEVTDNNGSTVEINIQDISSDASVRSVSSIAFPYIDVKAFIRGIGGSGFNSYSIKKFTTEATKQMFKDNWQQYTFGVDIPTFGIYQKNSVNYDWSTKFDRIQAQNNANTSYNNSKDSIDNTKVIAEDAIQTEKDVTNYDISYNIEINDQTMFYQGDQFELQAWNQEANAFVADAGQFSNTVGGAMAAIGTVAAGLALGPAGGAAAAATEGAAAAGLSTAGLAATGIQSLGVASSIGSYCGNAAVSTSMWNTQKALIERQAKRYVSLQNTLYGSDGQDSIDISTGAIPSIIGVSGTYEPLELSIPTVQTEGLVNEKTRAIKGEIWTHETKVKDNNYSVSSTNNSRVKSNAEAAIQNSINQAALGNNVAYSRYSTGGALDSEGLRGLDIKIKTQNSDSIRKAGNIFARYGYILDDSWTPSNLNLMTLFTYWEFSDIWLTSDKVFESALNVLREIFTSGVTVWSNPANIGKVNINSNRIA